MFRNNPEQLVDQQLGSYRLTKFLKGGGFGFVYQAEHIQLQKMVAIKLLKPEHVREIEYVVAFEQEARIIARLTHPHILDIYHYDLFEGIPYIVMPFIERGSLRAIHPDRSIVDTTLLLTYVKQIASALQYAHDRKIVHRDVKPDNFLLGPHGVLLSDFGIAITAHNVETLSRQDVLGSVLYMAPEQFERKAQIWSDQYSLAVVVYKWFCGKFPFSGETYLELFTEHKSKEPPTFKEQGMHIPHAVEQVVRKGLAKDPQARYSTVTEFADQLEQTIFGSQLEIRSTFLPPSTNSVSAPFIGRDSIQPLPSAQNALQSQQPLPLLAPTSVPPTTQASLNTPLPTQSENVPIVNNNDKSGGVEQNSIEHLPKGRPTLKLPMVPVNPREIGFLASDNPVNRNKSKTIPIITEASVMDESIGNAVVHHTGGTSMLSVRHYIGRGNNIIANKHVRTLLPVILGSVLYTGLVFMIALVNSFIIFHEYSMWLTFLPVSVSIILLNCSTIVALLLLGSIYGPWVGLLAGSIGTFVGNYLSGSIIPWNHDLGITLIGLISGLTVLKTDGYYKDTLSLALAGLMSTIAILIGIAFINGSDIRVAHLPAPIAWINFLLTSLPTIIISLLLLPVLLRIHRALRDLMKGRL